MTATLRCAGGVFLLWRVFAASAAATSVRLRPSAAKAAVFKEKRQAKIGGLVVSRVAGFERGEDERAEHVFDLDGLGDLGEGGGGGVLRGAVARGRIVRGGAIRCGRDARHDAGEVRAGRRLARGERGGRVTSRAKDVMS